MSLVTGYLEQLASGAPADGIVIARAAVWPVVRAGARLVVPDSRSVRARAVDGYWELSLGKGAYELSTRATNGQTAKLTISIEEEDDETYDFEQLVVSSLPLVSAPVGGAQPAASASVPGIIRAEEDHAQPVAVMGWFFKEDVAAMRAIASKTFNKYCKLWNPEERAAGEYRWDVSSMAADDAEAFTVVLPDDLDAGDPGRWIAL